MSRGYRLNIPVEEEIYIEIEDMNDFIKKEFQKRYKKNMDELFESILKRNSKIDENLLKAMDKLFLETIEQQKRRMKKPIKYIHFFYLWSSAVLGTNEIQVNLYSNEYYLDSCEAVTFWKPDFIMDYCKKDLEELNALAEKKVLHYCYYDYLHLRDKVYAVYHFLICKYLFMMVDQIVGLDSFQKLQKDELTISYGGYLDKQIKIWSEIKKEEQ